ncbi:MAG TPA: hypothetical protein VNE41_05790 [Chitinophagaceae bacterium]|nr:hypothetical protein [Chitinophagaceae bacterium]
MKSSRLLAFLLLILCGGCHSGATLPDISRIELRVHIRRFDEDLFRVDSDQVSSGLRKLGKQYPVFLPVYLSQIMNYGAYSDTSRVLDQELQVFLKATEIMALEDTVKRHFPNLNTEESQLGLAFRYTKYYIPSFHPPQCVAFISALSNYGAVTVDTILGIGLDMFLGPAYPYYAKVSDPYPHYAIRQFAPQYITADCMKVIEQQLFPSALAGKPLIWQMIDKGKQLYFLDRVMPGAPDSIKIGYTGTQLAWCHFNEQMIWQYFIQNNLLYTTDMQETRHYVGEGPSTNGMPAGSPGNIGSWIGWQIVRAYMYRKPHTTLLKLMNLTDYQRILDVSRYRPG